MYLPLPALVLEPTPVLAVLDVGKTNCMKRIDLITGCRTCKEPEKYGMKKGIIC